MKDNKHDLVLNIEKLHTTEMGIERIKKNLALDKVDVVYICREMILNQHSVITKRGKNWYINIDNCEITINANSFTIITAHKKKDNNYRVKI